MSFFVIRCNEQNAKEHKIGSDSYNYYRTLVKEGPWAVHLTLGQDWGVG